MKKILPSLLFLASAFYSAAQTADNPVYCGFDYFIQMKRTNDQEWYRAYEEVITQWRNEFNMRGGGGGEVYVIPVVFHIVYNTDTQNVPDSVVHSQMEVLNEDYRRMNEDAINTRDIFLPVAADCEIEFQLADFDPDGNPTTGITHTFTDETGFTLDIFSQVNTLDEVKHAETGGVDAWDPEHYLNIWVCNIEPSLFGQIFGLSYPPADLPNWPDDSNAASQGDDGVIVHYTTVGRNNPNADDDGTSFNNKGRTLTHEVGHYLGLRHTWGDEFFTDPCSEDDGIDDTPLCGSGDQYVCDSEANSCDDGTPDDLPDQLENYMDYTQDECYNMFTSEQRALMRFVLENQRQELIGNNALIVGEKNFVSFNAYPNPVNNQLTIQTGDQEIYSVTIHNNVGQIVWNGTMRSGTIDTSSLSPGAYSVRVSKDRTSGVSVFYKI